MELNPKQQTTELIKKSQKILLLSSNPDGDSLGAAISLFLMLKKLGKDPVMVCSGKIPNRYDFMPQITNIKMDFSEIRNFIFTLDVTKTPVAKLGYKIEKDSLNIIITPDQGAFSAEDVKISQEQAQLDLIIILDTPDLGLLGDLYENNAEIFYKTPVINIDHHATNDYFGKINLVDLTATSTCEILVSIVEALSAEQTLMDEQIATSLLTGIISDTGSFQNSNTTPKSLTVAAQLIAQGGQQQEIVKKLYKTKPLSTLKLWGRILAQIREDKENKFIWSLVTIRDLEQTSASEEEITGAIDELLTSTPDAEVVLLLSEREDGIYGSIRTTKGVDASEIAKKFGGGGHVGAAAFQLKNANLALVERDAVEKIRQFPNLRLFSRP